MSAVSTVLLARRYRDVQFLLAVTIVMFATFCLLTPSWLNWALVPTMIDQNAPLALISVAMTFAIISRQIDLSPGSMVALAGSVFGVVFAHSGSTLAAIAAALAAALLVGVGHGFLVARLGLSSIMVTLAAYIWARGVALAITDAKPIGVQGVIPDVFQYHLASFSPAAPIVVLAYVIGWFVLSRTRMGRYTYAMGGDAVAARRHGIAVGRFTVYVFVVMAVAVTISALIVVGQLSSAQPRVSSGLELDAIVAVVIGGTRLGGGEGHLGRTALGVAFLAVLTSGLANQGLGAADQQLYQAIVLLSVLAVQVVLRRRAAEDARRIHELRQRAAVVGMSDA